MLDALRKLIARATPPTPSAAPADARVGRPPELQVAAAALLLELAHADGEFTDDEQAHIRSALQRHFALDDQTITELIELADAERRQSIDHFNFTRLIAERYDLGQKMVLAEVMWGVILADGTVAEHEGYLMRKIANLLDLAPGYLSEARSRAHGPRLP